MSDLAVLKVDGNKLPKVKVGDSDKLKVGDWVVAIGSRGTISNGITICFHTQYTRHPLTQLKISTLTRYVPNIICYVQNPG